ncbi:MAG: adenosylcobinamide-phosphate synthase CbiB [Ketobacteraceae bacterium]|nr:adenosylcobinamide-phosphate synthase CbiB [Ketobacteraceae bacterium]
MLTTFLVILTALLLDRVLGEPRKWHPLVLFGQFASRLETRWNHDHSSRWHGVVAWCLSVGLITLAAGIIGAMLTGVSELMGAVVATVVLYLCIGWQSLKEHMLAIYRPLDEDNLSTARQACARVVSRDTDNLSAEEIAKAAVESTLENGNDGIFAALFWFALLGVPGVILYRLSNTLDAMWGYRTDRFRQFGWWSARADDALNWIPARITALLYCFSPLLPAAPWSPVDTDAQTAVQHDKPDPLLLMKAAWRHWQKQAPMLSSPNGGPVMVSGATVLDLRLGGPASYHDTRVEKPFFGGHQPPVASDIPRALQLVQTTLLYWVPVATALSLLGYP